MSINFWEIYDQHYRAVRNFILILVKDEWVADDIIQETFIKVQMKLPQLRDSSKLSSWITRIAYNLCQDHFRKVSRASAKEHALAQKEKILTEPIFQKEFEQHQMSQCVQDKMKLLPEQYRTILALFDLMDCSHQEIAELLDISVENVKIRLHRARKKFKTILESECRFEVDERNVLICDPIHIKAKI